MLHANPGQIVAGKEQPRVPGQAALDLRDAFRVARQQLRYCPRIAKIESSGVLSCTIFSGVRKQYVDDGVVVEFHELLIQHAP
jgi:hypothetical protein